MAGTYAVDAAVERDRRIVMRMRELTDRREYLLVRGRLTRDDTFTPRRCGSTTSIHRWPEAEQPDHGDVFAETLDAEGLARHLDAAHRE